MKTFQEIAKKHGHCRCVDAYTDRGLISPDCEIHDMEAAANEFAEQFAPRWIDCADRTPLCYETGDWDGKRSEFVACVDDKGNLHIARVYEGILDGSEFRDWYGEPDYEINNVVKWLPIPFPL